MPKIAFMRQMHGSVLKTPSTRVMITTLRSLKSRQLTGSNVKIKRRTPMGSALV
jgi:hypothetical protein